MLPIHLQNDTGANFYFTNNIFPRAFFNPSYYYSLMVCLVCSYITIIGSSYIRTFIYSSKYMKEWIYSGEEMLGHNLA